MLPDESIRAPLVTEFARRQLRDELAWTDEDFQAALAQLQVLLPDLGTRLAVMKVDVLVDLLRDRDLVAARVVAWRELLPKANVSAMISAVPTLVLGEFDAAIKNAQRLKTDFGDGVDEVIDQQWLILIEDLDVLAGEVQRLLGLATREAAVAEILARPGIVSSIVSNRGLSIW